MTHLWDLHLPAWRERLGKPQKPLDERLQRALLDLSNRVKKEALPVDPGIHVSVHEAAYVHMEREVYFQKGKWSDSRLR